MTRGVGTGSSTSAPCSMGSQTCNKRCLLDKILKGECNTQRDPTSMFSNLSRKSTKLHPLLRGEINETVLILSQSNPSYFKMF